MNLSMEIHKIVVFALTQPHGQNWQNCIFIDTCAKSEARRVRGRGGWVGGVMFIKQRQRVNEFDTLNNRVKRKVNP
jgi:hypothetical protein